MEQKKIILDVDTGSDDAIAIMLALSSPELDVKAITVTWGNRPVENCVENTLRVVELMNSDVPVYKGCPEAMVRYMNEEFVSSCTIVEDGVEYSLHPAYLDLPKATRKAEKKNAVSFIIDYLMNAEEKITFITVGPPTNLGMALRAAPQIKENIEEVVFMGGAINKGNAGPVSEANFYHDPEAAKIIIDSGVKCRIIGLNATHSAELNLDDAKVFDEINTPQTRLAASLLRSRVDVFRRLKQGNGYSDAIHDALAVASVIDPSVITEIHKMRCDIDLGRGLAYGQLVADCRYGNEPDENTKTSVALKADKDKFFKMLCERLG